MNILFLEGDMSRRGGTERMTSWLASRLAAVHTVYVISLHLRDEKIFFPMDAAVEHIVLGSTKTSAQLREIRRFIRKNAVDIVINVDTGMGYIGILAARRTGARVITWEHANYFNDWNSRIFPHLRRYAARKSDAMVVLTERDKHNYERNIKKCVPVTVIPNPARKHDHSYDLESETILSAGVLGRIKRFDLLVPIGRIVFAKHPNWKWKLCGDGAERAALENAVREAGLSDNIIFSGSVSNMEEQYAGAAIYAMTSEMEGMPMVLLEAKAYGLPIVSFDIETGPSDILRDGVNGYLVEPGNVDAMAARLCGLIEDRTLRKRFSDNAALDMDKFDEETIIKKWEMLIKSL